MKKKILAGATAVVLLLSLSTTAFAHGHRGYRAAARTNTTANTTYTCPYNHTPGTNCPNGGSCYYNTNGAACGAHHNGAHH